MEPQVRIFRDPKPGFTLADAVGYVTGIAQDDHGCIWLRHETGTQLAIMIKGGLTYPHFFPGGDHPGWQVAANESSDWNTSVTFRADNGERTPIPLAFVLPIARAVEVLRHYWQHGERTPLEQWTSLVAGEP